MSYSYWKKSSGVIDRRFNRCVDPNREFQVLSSTETETAQNSQQTRKKSAVKTSSFLIGIKVCDKEIKLILACSLYGVYSRAILNWSPATAAEF